MRLRQSDHPTPSPETRVAQLVEEAQRVKSADLQRAGELAAEALALAERNALPKGEADSCRVLAWCELHRGAFDRALERAMRTLARYRELADPEGEAYASYLLGSVHWRMGDLARALEYALAGIELARGLPERHNEMGLHVLLGGIYFDQGNYDEALRCMEALKRLAEREGAHNFQADALNNMAYAHYHRGRLDEARARALESLALLEEIPSTPSQLAALHTAVVVHIALGHYDVAWDYLRRGLALAEAQEVPGSISEFLIEMGKLALLQGDADAALAHLKRALEVAAPLKSPLRQAQVHRQLAEVCKARGEFAEALEHFERYHAHDKRVFNRQADQRLKALETLHEVEQARQQTEIYRLKNVALQAEVEQRKRSEARLKHLARHDALTGVYNRGHFLERAEATLGEAARRGASVGVAMCDVDDFKRVNDMHGHAVGDSILRAVADWLKRNVRAGDLYGRYGGDEFAVLFLDAAPETCRRIAERVRRGLEANPVHIDGAPFPITLSIGVTALARPETADLTPLFERADRALYRAKQGGKNQVRLAPSL